MAYIPTSGLGGENLVTRGQSSDLTKWYKGKCLLEQIGELSFPHLKNNISCFCVCKNFYFGEKVFGMQYSLFTLSKKLLR